MTTADVSRGLRDGLGTAWHLPGVDASGDQFRVRHGDWAGLSLSPDERTSPMQWSVRAGEQTAALTLRLEPLDDGRTTRVHITGSPTVGDTFGFAAAEAGIGLLAQALENLEAAHVGPDVPASYDPEAHEPETAPSGRARPYWQRATALALLAAGVTALLWWVVGRRPTAERTPR